MKEHLSKDPVLEIYFIDVGQGDSTFIVTPARKKILIDGGANDRAMRFLAWKYRLEDPSASQLLIDLLVLTHADEDHIGGLVDVISHSRIKVNKIIHSGLAIYKDGVFNAKLGNLVVNDGTKYVETWHDQLNNLDESKLSTNFRNWKRAIEEDGNTDYRAVDTLTGSLNIGDPNIKLEVLGPKTETVSPGNKKVYRWFGDHAHTINGHSVVLKLTYKDVSLLLAGDLNTLGEEHLLQDQVLAGKMDANILKAPHHGSHEFSRRWLDAVNPQISTISSGDDTDHGHPRAVFVGAIGNASRQPAHIFSTEIAANFVRLERNTGDSSDVVSPEAQPTLRELFKRRLHGMINVRTDGETLYAARRVASSYKWEYYVITKPALRSKP
jgi:beta-lactamase superfamily II metal-dependent hydrolase